VGDIADLARGAAVTIGNDTGPTHLAVAAGSPAVVLFSNESDPALNAPRAIRPDQPVLTLRAPDLADLGVDRVAAAVDEVRSR
jgi:ADP-heptose:LPS heptosyltransferase